MKILIVGDLHGNWGALNKLIQKKQPDIILQTGDFGWWPGLEVTKPVLYGQQKTWKLKGIKLPRGCKLYWCDGNHEEHWDLNQSGVVTEMYENVFHVHRGSVITLPDERRVLFMGGAASIDRDQRTPGHDWFPEENISQIQVDKAMSHYNIDIIISHTCPNYFRVKGSDGKHRDSNRAALDMLLEEYNPKLWYFGHWHRNVKGSILGTDWECLDYPNHGGKWWTWLEEK